MPAGDPATHECGASRSPLAGLSTYRIETWGCQMNEHDSEKMAGVLRSLGLRPALGEGDADIILLNTCSVREKAAQKVFTRLGQLKRFKDRRPHVLLGVCGCVAQQEQNRIFARAPYVDLVMGPRRIGSLPDLVRESRARGRALGLFDPKDTLFPEMDTAHRVSRTRAYVTVMEGCNKTCTFCIVPFTRGRESYRGYAPILQEVRECVDEGLVEIELLGQNVNAWRSGSWGFALLLEAVASTPGVRRVRFTTNHPLHFGDSIIDTMASRETICRHVNLPAQSGSDAVLKRMRRGYRRRDYLDRVGRLRERIPDVGLSTDIIVGFPGETEQDFQRTLSLLEEVRYDSVYSFLYSKRPNTPAAAWEDDLTLEEKKSRLTRLQELQRAIQIEKHRELEGSVVEVLVDGPSARAEGQVSGRTSQHHRVNIEGGPELVGRFLSVRIVEAGPHSLRGRLEEPLTFLSHRDIDNQQFRDSHPPRMTGAAGLGGT